MANKMLIDATHPEETRVVVLRGNRVEEFDFESANRKQLRGNIYLAKVTRVEPSLQAAFVDYGGNRHGFLAFSEIHPDYYQIPVADRQALIAEEERDAARRRSRRPTIARKPARRRPQPSPRSGSDRPRDPVTHRAARTATTQPAPNDRAQAQAATRDAAGERRMLGRRTRAPADDTEPSRRTQIAEAAAPIADRRAAATVRARMAAEEHAQAKPRA